MRLALAFILLFIIAPKARALEKASAQDVLDIEAQITKKAAAEVAIAENKRARKGATFEKISELDTALYVLERERKAAYNQAMWLTLRAYGIIPFVDNDPLLPYGDSVLRSPQLGKRITWVPIFDEIGPKRRQDYKGDDAGIKVFLPRNAGNTSSDGVSRIFPGAFDSPAELASYLIHEVRHFWQNTTPGKGDDKTTAELEVEAYEEELRLLNDPENPLGYTTKIKDRQLSRLTELLEGDGKRDPGFKKRAKKERADAIRLRGGRPLPELSIVSFSAGEIDGLIQQAKAQIVIAQGDHDKRLRDSVAALAIQSCNSAGTVTQQDLDELPLPHDRGYKQNLPFPADLDSCASWLYMDIRKGSNVEEIKSRVRSRKPVIVQPAPPLPSPFTPARPLSSIFWPLREFVIGACNGTLQAAHAEHLFGTYAVHFSEDDAAVSLKYIGDRNNCEKALFQKIIEKTRSNYGRFHLTDLWVRGVVAANPPKSGTSPGDAAPPDAVPPGVVPPPEQVHPIIPIPGDPWKPRKVKHDSANK